MPTLYAAMRDSLLVVADDPGGDWTVREALTDRDFECVAVHPDRPDRVLAGTYDAGLHRSTDGGRSWERIDRGFDAEAVMAVAVDPDDPDGLWAGTEPSAVYRSTDGGDDWTRKEGLTDLPSEPEWAFPPRPHTHHVRWIEVDPADPDRLYVSIEAGALVRSRDAGETWEDRRPDARRDNHSLATHPDAPGRAWAAAGDGYAETRDAGGTWRYPQDGLDHRYCWSVAVDDADPDTVLVSSARGAGKAHGHGGVASAESYLYRRTGDGPWERLDDRGIPTGEGVLRAVLAAGRAGEFYALNNRGLYRTADAGASWDRLPIDWPERFEEQGARGLAVV